MLKKLTYVLIPALVGLAAACNSGKPAATMANTATTTSAMQQSGQPLSTESYGKYLTELAADELEGRKPFTEGEKKTLAYLEREFKALGLEPGNGDSFLQEVPMVDIRTIPNQQLTVNAKGKEIVLEGREDYVLWTRRTEPTLDLNKTELVFAGFGIVAPEYNWNDYAGLDVKDKVVLIMVNDPGFYGQDPEVFKGRAMTYYGRWTYKFEEAARQGAKGCLIIHKTEPAGYGFEVVQNNWNTSKLYLDERGKESYKCAIEGWVTDAAARKLFEAAGMDYAAVTQKASKPGNKPQDMGVSISTSLKTNTTRDKSYNFVARITGSIHPEEAIIYSAHWDHLGIGKADEKGDSIYNGAVDDATGVAGLLELARAFKALPTPPQRSILFLAVTAEEQGLWGSAHYAENPIFPKQKTVADINMDMMNPYGKTKDIVLYGLGQSELEEYITEEAKAAGRYVAPEANPEAGLYYRSDHFNFAKIGVPALFVGPGTDHVEKGKAYGKQKLDEYFASYYHKPSDEVHADLKLDGAVDDLTLLFKVGKRLAFSAEWPKWKQGSEFREAREAYME